MDEPDDPYHADFVLGIDNDQEMYRVIHMLGFEPDGRMIAYYKDVVELKDVSEAIANLRSQGTEQEYIETVVHFGPVNPQTGYRPHRGEIDISEFPEYL